MKRGYGLMGMDNILVLAVVAVAMVLFITEKLRLDVTAMCVLVALLVLRLIEPGQALYGFANQATGTVAAMFVLSAGLVRTGFVDWLARRLDKLVGKYDNGANSPSGSSGGPGCSVHNHSGAN
ncbi:hypothetical protein E3J38_02120 [candidate division TA06 bacterium]|uniref:Citrate transporter-like domain-containing protein n=1 Tax=candidate division TA06 bacterium TaxID=2250710 RepID=A0A523XT47_UNCT6|nr:MAG: hypothetical protein E3J38_02120 [candidate division TA06 bacterium]